MTIRRATVADAELLARLVQPVQELHVQAQPHLFKPYSLTPELIADFENRLANDAVLGLIAEVEGAPVGYALAQKMERLETPYTYALRFVLLDQISINPEQRGQGYGAALLRAVYDWAQALDVKTILLNVGGFNTRAIAFYERQGFNVRDMRMEMILE